MKVEQEHITSSTYFQSAVVLVLCATIMRSLLTLLLITTLIFGCNSKNHSLHQVMAPVAVSKDSGTLYFGSMTSMLDSSNNKLDSFTNRWYSEILFALSEPILSQYPGERQAYRFTWLRSRHHPISIRSESINEIVQLSLKESDGMGGYKPGKLIVDTSFLLKMSDWTQLLEKISDANFWKLQTEQLELGQKDGAEWIIEGKVDAKYHFASRWSPWNVSSEIS